MSKRHFQGDSVHVFGTVEADNGVYTTVVFKVMNGQETRVMVSKDLIKHHERGPIKAGDLVFKKTKAGRLEGTVEHRSGDLAWVAWSDELHAVELVSTLSR